MKRKILANVLTLCMLFSMLPMTAFAATAEGLTVTVSAKNPAVESEVTLTIADASNGDLSSGKVYYKYATDAAGLPEAESTFDAAEWTLYEEDETTNNVDLTDAVNGQVVLAVYVEGTDTLTVKKGGVSDAIDDGTTPSTEKEIKSVTISGTAKVGETLTATVDPSDATVTYQWKAGGTNISGADKLTYVPVAADVGKTITVTVTGTGGYADKTATSTPTAAVVAADPAPAEKTKVTLEATMTDEVVYTGKAVTAPTVTAKNGTNVVDDIEEDGYTFTWYAADDTNNALKAAPVDAGNYKLVITLNENDKYTADPLEKTFEITKAAAIADLKADVLLKNEANATATLNLAPVMANYAGTLTYTVKTGQTPVGFEVSSFVEGSATLTAKGGVDAATKTETVVIEVDGMTNYNKSEITVTVTYTDKDVVDFGELAANDGLTYTGEPVVAFDAADLPTTPADIEWEITYAGTGDTTYNGTTAPTNAGTYSVTIAVPEDHATHVGSITLNFTVAKATLTATGTKTATAEEGKALSTVTIPTLTVKGVKDTAVEGTWAWVAPETVLAANSDAELKFTPKDTAVYDNYEELTETIAITVNPAPITMKTVTTDIVGVTATIVQPIAADPENNVAAQNGKVVLTGNMKKADGIYHIIYTTSKSDTPVEVTVLTVSGGTGDWSMENIVLTGGTYVLNAEAVEFLADNVDLKPVDPTVDASDEIKEALGEYDLGNAVSADASDILTNEAVSTLIPTKEEATALLVEEKVNVPTGSAIGSFTEVHVVSYFDIAVTDYKEANSSPENSTVASLKLDITPMVKRVAANVTDSANPVYADFKSETDTKATPVENYAASEPILFTVKLPTGFVSATTDKLVTKHHVDPIEWIRTDIDQVASDFVAKFRAETFSEYEIVADARTVTVTFDANGGTLVGDSSVIYTPDKIGTAFPTATTEDADKEFKGWADSATATSATYTGSLTDAYLTALVGAAEDDEITLYAVFGAKSTGTIPSGGGGGGGVSSNVTIDKTTNGKVTVTPIAPSKGSTVTITLTPDTGYVVGTVTVTDKDGKAVELTKVSDTKYTFTMPDGKVKVAATFTKVADGGFTDVAADAYYADAVKWAVDKGITNGLTATTFGPNNSCTRGQMVTFLWRAAGSPKASATNSFTDVASGEYYYDAVLWAVEKGITNGTTATTFSPNATVNRGQTVTFLYRYAGSPAATGTTSFTDVAADAYYANAVKWAVAEEITNGTSSTTFAPASNCTRGQIVTFLYRQIAE